MRELTPEELEACLLPPEIEVEIAPTEAEKTEAILKLLDTAAKGFSEKHSDVVRKMIGQAYINGILTEDTVDFDLNFIYAAMVFAYMEGAQKALMTMELVHGGEV